MEKRHLLLLAAFAVLIYFVGNGGLYITDPTESNYAQTAREMYEAGDYMSPRIYGHYWFDKPIMYYLEIILAYKMFGVSEFAVRFFPSVMASLGLFITYAFGAHFLGARRALVASLLLGTTVAYYYIGHAAITDTTMVFWMATGLMSFYMRYSGGRLAWQYLAFFALGMAMLTKGPIGLCLPGLIILIFLAVRRELRFFLSWHILLGFVLSFAVAATWYLPMFLLHGWDFINTFFGVHNYLRASVSEHPIFNVWYYYIIVFVAGFVPWSLHLIAKFLRTIWSGVRARQMPFSLPSDPLTQFLIIWALTVFGVFESFATKYITYTFPYMIPLALLFSRYFTLGRAFRGVIAALSVFYIVATNFIAPQYTYDYSGYGLRDKLEEIGAQDAAVYSYYINAPVSYMYYTGNKIMRVENSRKIAEMREAGINWNALNISPLVDEDYLELADDNVVITDKKGAKTINEDLPGNWTEVAKYNNLLIFRAQTEPRPVQK